MRRIGGWWRLWIAVSALWAVLAIGIGTTIVATSESAANRMKFSVELACPASEPMVPPPPSGYAIQASPPKAAANIDPNTVKWDAPEPRMKLSELKALDRCQEAKQRDYAGEAAKDRLHAIVGTALGAISLPLILLVLGLLTGWIIRGFRAGKSAQ